MTDNDERHCALTTSLCLLCVKPQVFGEVAVQQSNITTAISSFLYSVDVCFIKTNLFVQMSIHKMSNDNKEAKSGLEMFNLCYFSTVFENEET